MHFKFVYAFNVYAFHMMCERGPKKKIFQAAIVKRTFPGEKKLVPPMCMRIMCERRKGGEKDLPIAIFEGMFGKFETASVHVECVAECCIVLQCVAACCSVLHLPIAIVEGILRKFENASVHVEVDPHFVARK